ncbi:MAG: hypothetical protein JWQ42_624 [Edaphobacter sp.]|jgi:hypothetical protein|nr:hypothetical protein [Edaphobacter sp.]
MKSPLRLLLFAIIAIPIGASAQCARPELSPTWDAGQGQFRCIDPSAPQESASDEGVSPTGNKEFCSSARENLLKVCPASDEGKVCRTKAKSIFNACYKDSKSSGTEGHVGSSSNATQTNKTDASVCVNTFNQQQKACQSRRMPPPSPGQRPVADTCLQDALTAQSKCLANSR